MRPARLSQGRRRNPGTREHLVGSHHAKRAETSVNSDRSCCSWPAPPVPSSRRAGRCGPAPGAHRPPLRAHFVLIAGCRGVCSCSHVPVSSGDIARVRPRVLYCVGERRRDVVARAARPAGRPDRRGPDARAPDARGRECRPAPLEKMPYILRFSTMHSVFAPHRAPRGAGVTHIILSQMCEVIVERPDAAAAPSPGQPAARQDAEHRAAQSHSSHHR